MKNIKTSLISFFVIISMLLTTVVPAFAAENAALEDEFLSQTDFDLSEEAIEEIDKAAKEEIKEIAQSGAEVLPEYDPSNPDSILYGSDIDETYDEQAEVFAENSSQNL